MGALLLLFLAVTANSFPQLPMGMPHQMIYENLNALAEMAPSLSQQAENQELLQDIQAMLKHEAPELNSLVVDKVRTTLLCANKYNVNHNHILTIIDYSLPSNEKRLWVFDINEKKLLFNTYVSHGLKSGALMTDFFSNKFNSKASSLGVYQTQQAYYGRDGLSLRLDGLDGGFNDNASSRAIVMHSGWYVEEDFIKKYGRPGRSWGCPALPLERSQAIINTIKDKSLLVIYYPSDKWFSKSKFLNCTKDWIPQEANQSGIQVPVAAPDEHRDAILFVGEGYKNNRRTETKPVAVISAQAYQRIFHAPVPLTRMLRRQINHEEYIALSTFELNNLISNPSAQEGINTILFVIPVLKVVRGGYYETQMEPVNLGKIKEIKINSENNYTVYFEGTSAVSLNANNQFIRWVGL